MALLMLLIGSFKLCRNCNPHCKAYKLPTCSVQKLGSGGRILVELPGVKDKARVRELLQGTANLEFWETYENQDVAQYFEAANNKLRAILNPESIAAKDSIANDSTKAVVAPNGIVPACW